MSLEPPGRCPLNQGAETISRLSVIAGQTDKDTAAPSWPYLWQKVDARRCTSRASSICSCKAQRLSNCLGIVVQPSESD